MSTEGTAAWYRARAAKLRELAMQSRDPDTRIEQLKMAEQFDRLAQHAEAQEARRRDAGD